MTDESKTVKLNEQSIQLLENLNQSVEELESPALSQIETRSYAESDDVVCGVCGENDAYGKTWIVEAFDFPETPEDQDCDRLCYRCLGIYLKCGEWRPTHPDN